MHTEDLWKKRPVRRPAHSLIALVGKGGQAPLVGIYFVILQPEGLSSEFQYESCAIEYLNILKQSFF